MSTEEQTTTQEKPFTIDQVKPYKENILVWPVPYDKERTLPSGLVIPDTALEFHDKPRWGTVIAVGSEVKEVRPADNVMIVEGAGMTMEFQDEYSFENDPIPPIKEYIFVREEHILMVMSKGDQE